MSSHLLGKKEAIYSLPQKLAVTACAGRRLRCKWAGDSGQAPGVLDHPGRPEIPVQRAGDSGNSPGMLRAPIQYRTIKMQRAEKKLEAGDSGSFGPETPDYLQGTSGPQYSTAPQNEHRAPKNTGPECPGPLGRRLRWYRRLRTISGVDPTSKTRTALNFAL